MVRSSFAMLLFILFLQLICAINAEYSVKCFDDPQKRTVFKPSADGVSGRFDVEWCTVSNKNATDWNLVLSYNLVKKKHNCNKDTQKAYKHSQLSAVFKPQDVNCTNICFYTSLDLVFTSCFVLENWLPALGSHRSLLGQYVTNNLTLESFNRNIINADAINHEKHVAVHWYLDKVVATSFEMQLCENLTAAAGERREDRCDEISDKCSVIMPARNEIVCELWNLNGSYYIELTHTAPWKVGGVFHKQVYTHYSFNVTEGVVSVSPPPAGAALWWCGGAALLAAAGAAAACARRGPGKGVLSSWQSRKPGIEVACAEHAISPCTVLLVYAREGERGAPLIRALVNYMEAAHMRVLDLYSPEVVSLSAAAPADWLRVVLRHADTRLVLLQTPALAAMYGDRAPPMEPCAAALLSRRVAPAEPSPADALLALALRTLAEDVHTPAPYNKYFLATLESLETDTLPYTVPFRRYRLPAHAPALLRDLQPAPVVTPAAELPEPAEHLPDPQALIHAAHDFIQYVQDQPAYLKDHLIIIP